MGAQAALFLFWVVQLACFFPVSCEDDDPQNGGGDNGGGFDTGS